MTPAFAAGPEASLIMSTVTAVNVPARHVEAPPLAVALGTLAARLWRGLAGPAVSSERRDARTGRAGRIAEAAAVRRYAMSFARHDPRFAADLFSAADRHERGE